jgi:hypothetical protein
MATSTTISPAPPIHMASGIAKNDVSHLEGGVIGDMDKRDHMDYDRVDKEVAAYSNDVAVYISEEENIRLRKLVDRKVLVIMIVTYFLQAIDKGTLSFSAIMGIRTDTNLNGQQVGTGRLVYVCAQNLLIASSTNG